MEKEAKQLEHVRLSTVLKFNAGGPIFSTTLATLNSDAGEIDTFIISVIPFGFVSQLFNKAEINTDKTRIQRGLNSRFWYMYYLYLRFDVTRHVFCKI